MSLPRSTTGKRTLGVSRQGVATGPVLQATKFATGTFQAAVWGPFGTLATLREPGGSTVYGLEIQVAPRHECVFAIWAGVPWADRVLLATGGSTPLRAAEFKLPDDLRAPGNLGSIAGARLGLATPGFHLGLQN